MSAEKELQPERIAAATCCTRKLLNKPSTAMFFRFLWFSCQPLGILLTLSAVFLVRFVRAGGNTLVNPQIAGIYIIYDLWMWIDGSGNLVFGSQSITIWYYPVECAWFWSSFFGAIGVSIHIPIYLPSFPNHSLDQFPIVSHQFPIVLHSFPIVSHSFPGVSYFSIGSPMDLARRCHERLPFAEEVR